MACPGYTMVKARQFNGGEEYQMPGYTVIVIVRHSVDIPDAASLPAAIKEALDTYQENTPTIEIEIFDEAGEPVELTRKDVPPEATHLV